jgi:hypothetical protein
MASTMMMERTGMGMPGMGAGMMPAGGTTPMMPNMMMVPRCKMKFDKVAGGMKVTCTCDDPTAASMMQNLCNMLAGGMVSYCAMMSGMTACCCNMVMCQCKCEMTKDGCVMTCTSGDAKCAEMIQGCCDCLTAMVKAGCSCCMMMNGTPVCCCC